MKEIFTIKEGKSQEIKNRRKAGTRTREQGKHKDEGDLKRWNRGREDEGKMMLRGRTRQRGGRMRQVKTGEGKQVNKVSSAEGRK